MPYLLPLSAVFFIVTGRVSGRLALGLAVLVAVHVMVMVWFDRAIQRVPGPSLLLLRVFGVKKSSALTLDGLLDRWRQVGCYVTVMDLELLRQRAPVVTFGNSLLHFPLVFLLLLFWDSYAELVPTLLILASLSLAGFLSDMLHPEPIHPKTSETPAV